MKPIAISMNFKQLFRGNDLIEQNYIEYYSKFDILPILISNALANPTEYCRHFDVEGIILTGGIDIETEVINADSSGRGKKCRGRDAVEWQLLKMAVESNMPVLGICRGMQLINLFFGGNIIINMDKTIPGAISHTAVEHDVIITDSGFQSILKCDSLRVNSFHNHGLIESSIAPDLCEFARCAEDNSVEGIFHPGYPILGIQWHPERREAINENEFQLLKTFFTQGKFLKGK